MSTFRLRPDPLDGSNTQNVLISLFKEVKNAAHLLEIAKSGQMFAAAIRASMIPDQFVLLTAINQALYNEKHQCMKTKTLYAETLYCLAPTKSISHCLQTFGLQESTSAVVFVFFGEEGSAAHKEISSQVDGEEVPLEQLDEHFDLQAVQTVYDLKNLKKPNLVETVLTKMHTKDFLRSCC
ncbi:unnamed protein product, partial [Mesorhabditis spiculigera]